MSTEEKTKMINGLAQHACNQILAGVLLRNVNASFTNAGLSEKTARNLTRLGEIKAREQMAYAARG